MMEMYWSAVQIFSVKPENTVEATILARRCIKRIKTEVIVSNMPLAVMAPPKHIAQIISQIVFIIPAIPRVDTKEFNISFPVSNCVEPYNVMNTPLNMDAALMLSAPAICCNRLGWNNRAKTAASSADINRVMSGANRLAISNYRYNHQDCRNVEGIL